MTYKARTKVFFDSFVSAIRLGRSSFRTGVTVGSRILIRYRRAVHSIEHRPATSRSSSRFQGTVRMHLRLDAPFNRPIQQVSLDICSEGHIQDVTGTPGRCYKVVMFFC